MLKRPGPESTRSQLTRPCSFRRKRSSSSSRSVPGAKAGCPPAGDGPGDTEAGGVDRRPPAVGDEARDRVLERRELTARELRRARQHEGTVPTVEQGERRLGPADVAGEDHYFLAPA